MPCFRDLEWTFYCFSKFLALLCSCFHEFVHQACGQRVFDPVPDLGRGGTEPDKQVRFAGPGVASWTGDCRTRPKAVDEARWPRKSVREDKSRFTAE